jgi:hypothetical protein
MGRLQAEAEEEEAAAAAEEGHTLDDAARKTRARNLALRLAGIPQNVLTDLSITSNPSKKLTALSGSAAASAFSASDSAFSRMRKRGVGWAGGAGGGRGPHSVWGLSVNAWEHKYRGRRVMAEASVDGGLSGLSGGNSTDLMAPLGTSSSTNQEEDEHSIFGGVVATTSKSARRHTKRCKTGKELSPAELEAQSKQQ